MLDAKIASALKKLLTSVHFRKKVSVEEQRAQKYDRFLRGKHVSERVVLGKGSKVLISWSAQRVCPPHRGR